MVILPVQALYQTGMTVYAIRHGIVNGSKKYLNVTDGTWDTFNAGDWADYVITMTEDGSTGYYSSDTVDLLVDAVITDVVYVQGGGSPSASDTPFIMVNSQGDAIAAIAGDQVPAQNMGAAAGIQITGSLVSVTDASNFVTDLSDTIDGVYIGRLFAVTSGAAIRQVAYISDYNGTTKAVVLASPLVTTPSASDEFVII